MLIDRDDDALVLLAPAKVNLYLNVLGKRSDGYHDIETLLCPIGLADRLEIRSIQGQQSRLTIDLAESVPVPGDHAWDIPSDERNLIHKALSLVNAKLGRQHGWNVHLSKRVPAAAGLGGGSSDAAAAIAGALIACSSWDRELATQICAEIGSDVAFFLGDAQGLGLCWATGRGEICDFLHHQPKMQFVVSHPPMGCSTAEIYRNYTADSRHPEYREILAACESGQIPKIGAAMFNALQSAASQKNDWIAKQLHAFQSTGFEHSMMSGSGSSCFAVASEIVPEQWSQLFALTREIGIPRVYRTESWYLPSIESQL